MTEEKDQTEERPEDNPYWDVHPLSYWREAFSEANGEEEPR